ALGDLFIPTVARGRKEYGHPAQLGAMIRAGLVDRKSALWDGTPTPISVDTQAMLEVADPAISLKAATSFVWSNPPRYHMFKRKIAGWNTPADVKKILPAARA